jgi:protein-S-isoprenylcysteine O-methyltransferase Ste14
MMVGQGSWIGAAAIATWSTAIFTFGSIPQMTKYMKERYGDQWRDYVNKVPSGLFPGIPTIKGKLFMIDSARAAC